MGSVFETQGARVSAQRTDWGARLRSPGHPWALQFPTKSVYSLQLVTACAMQAFHSLFHAKPALGTLPAELNAQIITVRPGGGGRGMAALGWGGPVRCLQSEVEWAKLGCPCWRPVDRQPGDSSASAGAGGPVSCLSGS